MNKSHAATMLLLGVLSLGVVVYGSGPAQDIPQRGIEIRETAGRLTLLSISESGVYHVKVKLDSEPQREFTFALGGSSKEAMLSLLREAFVRNMTVEIFSTSYRKSSADVINQVSLKR